jgi:hypothetical protein
VSDDDPRYGNARLGRTCNQSLLHALFLFALLCITHPERLIQAWKDTK